MNGGGDAPVDFYSTPKLAKGEERLYEPQTREVISYLKDGRVMLDGQLVVTESPEELWQDLIMRVVWYMLCKDHLDVKEFKMPKGRTFRNFFRLKSVDSSRVTFHNGKPAYSTALNVAAETTSTPSLNSTNANANAAPTATTTTETSIDPKTGAQTVTKTTTFTTPNGKSSTSRSLTSVFLKKQKFIGSGNSAYPHSRRVVGKS
uniref:Uncharacterized protein n=1 Tax=Panagrolaimus sp. PS1159 TaxID=55785 RepID=A0AC35F8C8_9BILA